MEFVTIPPGTLIMGDPRLRDASPQHRLEMRAFEIGKYPVTNAEYTEFIADDSYRNEMLWTGMGWKWQQGRLFKGERDPAPGFWHDPQFNRPRQPVVGVSWYEAVAFCNWLTNKLQVAGSKLPHVATENHPSSSDVRPSSFVLRLPSEAEWEYAARGANSTRNFPWGERFEPGRANTAEAGFGTTTPIAHFPAGVSPFGVWDMAGNVFEWTLSKWGASWQELQFTYTYRTDDGREDLEGSGARVMRGGSWFNSYQEALCAYRSRYLAGSRGSNIGFRVVRTFL